MTTASTSTVAPRRLPLQTLSLSPSGRLLAVSYAGVIQLVDLSSGKLIASSSEADSHKKSPQQPACTVRQLVWWKDDKLVSSGEDKMLKEWAIDVDGASLVLKEERELTKRANAISISKEGDIVLVADKFGDVYTFAMHGCNPTLPSPPVAHFPPSQEALADAAAPSASTSGNGEVGSAAGANGAAEAGAEGDSTAAPPSKRQKQIRYDNRRAVEPTNGDGEADAKPKKHKGGMFKPQDGIRRGSGQAPEWRHVAAKISATAPLLGHVSLLTAMLLLDDADSVRDAEGKASLPRIITADRDEHVRVSRWPQGWRIERFLLGQKKFVSCLALHPSNPNLLLAAGGDDTVRVWDLTTYRCIDSTSFSLEALKGTAEITLSVPPMMQGKRIRRKLGRLERERQAGREKSGSQAPASAPTNGEAMEATTGAGVGTEAEAEAGADAGAEAGAEAEVREATPGAAAPEVGAGQPQETTLDKLVALGVKLKTRKLDLAIRKMTFVSGPSGEAKDGVLVFSSVGSDALLAYPTAALHLDGTSGTPENPQLIKLHHPVLDITSNATTPYLFVSLDIATTSSAEESSGSTEESASSSTISAIRCYALAKDGSGRLEPVDDHPALAVLNAECSIPVNEAEPYPDHNSLYPEIGLLSKDPSGPGSSNGQGEEQEEGDDSMLAEE